MNGASAAPRLVTYLPPAKRFDWSNLGVRVLSATVLVPVVLGAIWADQPPLNWLFLIMLAVAVALLAIEWAGMSAPLAPIRVAFVVALAVLTGLFIADTGATALAWAATSIGAVTAALIARGVAERPADAALGVIYIGVPGLCLIWLRSTDQGQWWTLMLFAITWSADIAAYAVGNALKGPKLWPRFSPNKTWSGFFGGLLAAMVTGALVAAQARFQLNLTAAAFVGLAGGLATMGGDLWESMLKRRFGVKDSGDLIPGHGGLLDRVDGLMFAVVIIAGARLVNHLGWGH